DVEERVRRRLEDDELRPRERAPELGLVVAVEPDDGDPEAREQVAREPERPAVDSLLDDDLVAGAEQAEEDGRDRRHARRERERRLGSLEDAELLLEERRRRVAVAGVEVRRRVGLAGPGELGPGLELERRALVDRWHERPAASGALLGRLGVEQLGRSVH